MERDSCGSDKKREEFHVKTDTSENSTEMWVNMLTNFMSPKLNREATVLIVPPPPKKEIPPPHPDGEAGGF